MILELEKSSHKVFLPIDENGRQISIFNLKECKFVGDLYYPNPVLKSTDGYYRVIREKTMSLNIDRDINLQESEIKKVIDYPVFFFVYNTDNYYHFIYDTLPYLISFLELKKELPNIKLLMNYPNTSVTKFYRFVIEFLEILNINIENDVVIIDGETLYSDVYISSSYTHDDMSDQPPRKEIFEFYKKMVDMTIDESISKLPKKIYISRRTWLNKSDISNIGTNYTSRRKLMNEDELVDILNKNDYTEVFTENLSTVEKLLLFYNAESVVGAIGGGVCNVLFCKPSTKVLVLVSPTFLDINDRFKYSLDCCDTTYYKQSSHYDSGFWKKYMRVSVDSQNIVGEVFDTIDSHLIISYTKQNVAGWNNQIQYSQDKFKMSDCRPLDNGLNSPWVLDLEKINKYL